MTNGGIETKNISCLPEELIKRSLSPKEIVLIYNDALNAINYLVSSNIALIAWEGWIKYSYGNHDHSKMYQGTMSINQFDDESWEDYVSRSANICRDTIKSSQQNWDINPEIEGGKLYFCLTCKIPE